MYVEGRHTPFREYHNTHLSYVISLERSLSPLGIGGSSQGKEPGNEVHSHQLQNRPFPSYFEPHYESEAKCKVFVMKISFHSYANKTNFHMKSFALSLAFIVRFRATRKWLIPAQHKNA